MGIYLLLAGETQLEEITAGALAAAVAAAAAALVRRHSKSDFNFGKGWAGAIARGLGGTVRGCGIMLVANCRRPFRTRGEGRFDAVEFNPGNDSPTSRGRRALVIAAISLAPDSFVLDLDRPGRQLILHRYGRPESKPRNTDWPL